MSMGIEEWCQEQSIFNSAVMQVLVDAGLTTHEDFEKIRASLIAPIEQDLARQREEFEKEHPEIVAIQERSDAASDFLRRLMGGD